MEYSVDDNLNLVWMVVNRMNFGYIDKDDMFQSGCMGLLRALETYNPKRGKLSTYAVPFIIGEINKLIKEYNYILYDLKEEEIINLCIEKKPKNDIYIDDEVNKLDDLEKNIIKLRYEKNFTQTMIAQVLNITQSKVSRTEKSALTKLKKQLSSV